MADMLIRSATLDDAPALARLRWRFKTEEDGADREAETADVFVPRCEAWLRARLTTGGAPSWRAWIAEADGRACGHVFLCPVEKMPSPHASADALG